MNYIVIFITIITLIVTLVNIIDITYPQLYKKTINKIINGYKYFFERFTFKKKYKPTFKNLNELAREMYLKNAGTSYVKWLNINFPGEELNQIAYQLMAKEEKTEWGNVRSYHTVYGKLYKDFESSDFVEIDSRSVVGDGTKCRTRDACWFEVSLDKKDVDYAVNRLQKLIDELR